MPRPTMYVEDDNGFLRRWTPPIGFQRTNEMHLFILELLEKDGCLQEFRDKAQKIMRLITEDNT